MSFNPPLPQWRDRTVWIVGASSGIGLALAEAVHAQGAQVIVSARNTQALNAFVQTHPGAQALPLDITDLPAVQAAAQTVLAGPGLDLVCCCAGYYSPMRATAIDLPEMLRHQRVNVEGTLALLAATVPTLLERGHGHISLVSSVAGFRGLPKSLAYGPTKAALINLAETLYMDLSPCGLGVSLITPGFVATPLTAQNDFEMPAVITPEVAAQAILKGWARGEFHLHFPRRFTNVMRLLRLLPYGLYFALVRRLTGL
jgi:NAD(P)-dependent dehydrogenase (short-subunit alcohol dehydrogenase family)